MPGRIFRVVNVGIRMDSLFRGNDGQMGVGRVPDCAERKKKPDTHLSAFCVTRSVTPEADLLICETASIYLTPLGR
jgi:hypothetical protein